MGIVVGMESSWSLHMFFYDMCMYLSSTFDCESTSARYCLFLYFNVLY